MRRLINELQADVKKVAKTKSSVTLAEVRAITKKWSSKWSSDHAQLMERLELMWDMYDYKLDGQLDSELSKFQVSNSSTTCASNSTTPPPSRGATSRSSRSTPARTAGGRG